MTTLGDDYPREQQRCRKLLIEYKKIPTGVFGAACIEQVLREADAAAISGDVVEMVRAYNAMKECQ